MLHSKLQKGESCISFFIINFISVQINHGQNALLNVLKQHERLPSMMFLCLPYLGFLTDQFSCIIAFYVLYNTNKQPIC